MERNKEEKDGWKRRKEGKKVLEEKDGWNQRNERRIKKKIEERKE